MPQKNNFDDTPGLRLFLDSADLAAWRDILPGGAFHGITTNPLLLERAGLPCSPDVLHQLVEEAEKLPIQEIHLQTWGRTTDEMIANGQALASLDRPGLRVALKVPMTTEGMAAAVQLRATGCPLTLTAVFSSGQVLLAAGFQAAYVAPYLGRLNDQGLDGAHIIQTMDRVLKKSHSPTRLLVASLRTAGEVVNLASTGIDTLTFGPGVAADLLQDPLTDRAHEDFLRAVKEGGRPQA
nr:transaldolase family protein [Candidatus Krumholzibacteria bacterium]